MSREDKPPEISKLRWSVNRTKTLYTWGVHGSDKRKSTKNKWSEGIPVRYETDGKIVKIPKDKAIQIWLKDYFNDSGHIGELSPKKFRWRLNCSKTRYHYRFSGSDQRRSTKNKYSTGIPVEYNENGVPKNTPNIESVKKWIAEYFRTGEEQTLLFLLPEILKYKEIKVSTRICYERHARDFSKWLNEYFPEIRVVNKITTQHSKAYANFIKHNKMITTSNKVSRRTVDIYCFGLGYLFREVAEKVEFEDKLPFSEYKKYELTRDKKKKSKKNFFTEKDALYILKHLKQREIDLGPHWDRGTHLQKRYGNLYHTSMIQHYTGCRLSDACCMLTEAINLKKRIISYTPYKTAKHGTVATVYIMDDEFYDYLSSLESIKNNETFVRAEDALRFFGCETEQGVLNRLNVDHADFEIGTQGSVARYQTELSKFLDKLPLPDQEGVAVGHLKYFKSRGDLVDGMTRRPALLNTHAFRHGFGFRMAAKGVVPLGIMTAMGHTSLAMTEVYMSHSDDDVTRRMFTGEIEAPTITPIQQQAAEQNNNAEMLKLLESLDGVNSMRELFTKIDEAKANL